MTEYTWEEQRAVENADSPGYDPNQNQFHEYRDENGQVVHEYAMDPEQMTVTPGAHVDVNTVIGAMIQLADRRLSDQLPYVHEAVFEFQNAAHDQIAQFVHEHEPRHEIGWGTIVEGLTTVLTAVFLPELEAAKIAFDLAAKAFTAGLEVDLENATAHLDSAREQLEHGVGELTTQIGIRTQTATEAARPHIHQVIHDHLQGEQHPTMDSEWIDAMVEWFGVPERTRDTVTVPIVAELHQSFGQLLAQVQSQFH